MTVCSFDSIFIIQLTIHSEDGETPTLAKLHSEEFKDEYDNLANEEREEIIARHVESSSAAPRQRVTAKARVQDVATTVRTMQQLVRTVFVLFIVILH